MSGRARFSDATADTTSARANTIDNSTLRRERAASASPIDVVVSSIARASRRALSARCRAAVRRRGAPSATSMRRSTSRADGAAPGSACRPLTGTTAGWSDRIGDAPSAFVGIARRAGRSGGAARPLRAVPTAPGAGGATCPCHRVLSWVVVTVAMVRDRGGESLSNRCGRGTRRCTPASRPAGTTTMAATSASTR